MMMMWSSSVACRRATTNHHHRRLIVGLIPHPHRHRPHHRPHRPHPTTTFPTFRHTFTTHIRLFFPTCKKTYFSSTTRTPISDSEKENTTTTTTTSSSTSTSISDISPVEENPILEKKSGKGVDAVPPPPPPPPPTTTNLVDAHPILGATISSSSSNNTNNSNNTTTSTSNMSNNQIQKKKNIKTKLSPRLPMVTSLEEFPPDRTQALRRQQATMRILKIAGDRLIEPPTLHLLVFTAWATMGIASLEGILLCQEWPWYESWDAGKFVWWYSLHQLIPSIVWDSQDAVWVARSLDLDPDTVLRNFSLSNTNSNNNNILDPESATALLRIHLLSSTRYFVAGFMMIASIVRAAGVSAGAFSQYEERIRLGREPPLQLLEKESPGVVIRMCGRDSFTTEVSLQKMGVHLFPVFEQPDRVQYLVWRHSEKLHRPVFWCVREGKYGSAYSWDRFPADPSMFIPPAPSLLNFNNNNDTSTTHANNASNSSTTSTGTSTSTPKLLILEADATNPHDPLALGNTALDLNLDDASQGFRRIQERFSKAHPHLPGQPNNKPFRTVRVYLGNSLEIARTGGGHSYTLRHRVRYAKEIDVLIDSRAPVLERILEWCRRVASGGDRRIFFQTSSPEYFKSLQKILKCYGYEIYDPLDLRTLWLSHHRQQQQEQHQQQKQQQQQEQQQQQQQTEATSGNGKEKDSHGSTTATSSGSSTTPSAEEQQGIPPSLLGILMEDPLLYDMWQERGVKEILDTFYPPSMDRLGGSSSSSSTSTSKDGDGSSKEKGFSDATTTDEHHQDTTSTTTSTSTTTTQQRQKKNAEMLRQVARMAKLPRLVHMPTTAETVNAVEALITAGEVDATNCCAILERAEGVAALEYILQQKSDLVRGERHQEWIQDTEEEEKEEKDRDEERYSSFDDASSSASTSTSTSTNNTEQQEQQQQQLNRWAESRRHRSGGGAGLQMICTSTLYDDLFRQVRMWARMGFTSAQIQKEMDLRFHEILDYSHEVEKEQEHQVSTTTTSSSTSTAASTATAATAASSGPHSEGATDVGDDDGAPTSMEPRSTTN